MVVVFVNQENPSDETTTTAPTTGPTGSTDQPNPPQAITLEDFLDNKLYPSKNNATWISNTELLYRDANVIFHIFVQTFSNFI